MLGVMAKGGGSSIPEEARAQEAGGGLFARLERWRERQFDRLISAYGGLLGLVLARRRFVLLAAAGGVAISLGLVAVVGLDFFPSVDACILRLHLRAPASTRIEETERLVDAVERRIRDIVPPAELSTINDNIVSHSSTTSASSRATT